MSGAFTLQPKIRAVDDSGAMTPEFYRALNKALASIDGSPLGQMTMQANATATTIAAPSAPVKIEGATALGSLSQKFDHTSNRLTYTGAINRVLRVSVVATMTTTATNRVGLHIYKNGAAVAESAAYMTTDAAGRAQSLVSQALVELATGDYLEAFAENTTAANNLTATYLSVIADAVN